MVCGSSDAGHELSGLFKRASFRSQWSGAGVHQTLLCHENFMWGIWQAAKSELGHQETTIMGFIGIIGVIYIGNIGIMENTMETTI